MSFAPSSTYFDCGDGSIIGSFTEKDYGNLFEFSARDEAEIAEFAPHYPHKVWVTTPIDGIDSGYRYALVKKTVAYILVWAPEDDGPQIEKWSIKGHTIYSRNKV